MSIGTAASARARVVLIGGGFAGSSCALRLRALAPELDVVLIDPDARYVTGPMSNEVVVGLRDSASITITRAGLQRAGVHWVQAKAVAIDGAKRRVTLHDESTLSYDRLVVAPGIRFLWGQPEGYDETAARHMPHAWQAGAQTELLAAKLQAMPAGGVFAVSVPAGPMRCPPGPYERAALVAGWLRRHRPRGKVLIFDANNHFPRQDIFAEAWSRLYPGMIDWIPVTQGGAVERVDVAKGILYTSSGAHRVDVANIIPPQAPATIAREAGIASDHGWCPIRPESFESQLIERVHVIGDACIADAMPKSASAACSQAAQCAAAMVALLDGRDPAQPAFDSVCYSVLAADEALAIHGRFMLRDGQIQPVPISSTEPERSSARADEWQRAHAWYRRICAEAFAV